MDQLSGICLLQIVLHLVCPWKEVILVSTSDDTAQVKTSRFFPWMPTIYYYTICYQIEANMTLALGQYIIVPYLSHGKEEEGGGEYISCFAFQMWLQVL